MGLFAGSLTSTPTLQAAIDAAGNRDPAIGYSVAYPFGVIGPILCLFAFSRLVRPRLAPAPAPLQPLEITLHDTVGATVAELMGRLPPGVDLVAIRQGGTNKLFDPQARLAPHDGVLPFGSRWAEKAGALGSAAIPAAWEGPSSRRRAVFGTAYRRRHTARANSTAS
jgi:putative transport protein